MVRQKQNIYAIYSQSNLEILTFKEIAFHFHATVLKVQVQFLYFISKSEDKTLKICFKQG